MTYIRTCMEVLENDSIIPLKLFVIIISCKYFENIILTFLQGVPPGVRREVLKNGSTIPF